MYNVLLISLVLALTCVWELQVLATTESVGIGSHCEAAGQTMAQELKNGGVDELVTASEAQSVEACFSSNLSKQVENVTLCVEGSQCARAAAFSSLNTRMVQQEPESYAVKDVKRILLNGTTQVHLSAEQEPLHYGKRGHGNQWNAFAYYVSSYFLHVCGDPRMGFVGALDVKRGSGWGVTYLCLFVLDYY